MSPKYTNPGMDPAIKKLLDELIKAVYEIRDIVLDLQARQKEMEERQLAIKKEVAEAPAMQPGTGLYQK